MSSLLRLARPSRFARFPRLRFYSPASLALLGLLSLPGCGGSGGKGDFTTGDDDAGSTASGGGGGGDAGTNLGGGTSSDAGIVLTISDAAPTTTPALLYAHDDTTLYQIDPTDPTLAATSLGTFDCIGGSGASSMTDIAIDDAQNVFGVATSTIFLDMKIAAGGVQCTTGAVKISGGSVTGDAAKFYGASLAPEGTIDPSAQALVVGNNQGNMYAVDETSGALTIVGSFGTVPANDGNGNAYPSGTGGGAAGTTFQMSGDIVFLDNGGSPLGFATVRDCTSTSTCSKTDTLVELDLTKMKSGNTGSIVKAVRGQVRKAAGCTDANNTSYGSMYGIAAYGTKIIGFSHDGFIVSISNADGTACLIHDYSGTIAFDGAGVTTKAPVTAPPAK